METELIHSEIIAFYLLTRKLKYRSNCRIRLMIMSSNETNVACRTAILCPPDRLHAYLTNGVAISQNI